MRPVVRPLYLSILAAAAAAALVPAAAVAAPAGAAGTPATTGPWTKISTNTGLGLASAGLLRTADGRLHVVWTRDDGTTYSLHYSTVGAKAKLLATGVIVQKWQGISSFPRLVAGPGGDIRLIVNGGNGQNNSPFNLGAVYTATSNSAGTSWTFVHGSLSHSTIVPLTDDAAAAQANGTPVAAWDAGASLAYHVGVDPNIPATSSDQSVAVSPGPPIGPTLARNSDGSIWAAWFTESGQANQGYWVDRLLPSQGTKVKAPGSGGVNVGNNQPNQAVAFAARVGGGLYLAYCVPAKTVLCAHVALWKVGAAKALTVPGSATTRASHVAIAAAPGGHLWVAWYDSGLNKVRVVRTSAAATRFGAVLTLPVPAKAFEIDSLAAEGSRGPLDLVALARHNASGFPFYYWDAQLLARLKLAGKPARVSHTRTTSVTFTVTDAGSPVAGAKVSFLGKTVTTNSQGVAKVTVLKGTKPGKRTATATKSGYVRATFTITVT